MEHSSSNNTITSAGFPLAKIKKLIKITAPNFQITSEAISMMNHATEIFIETLARSSAAVAVVSNRKTVLLKDLGEAVRRDDRFIFTREVVPLPIKYEEAIKFQN